MVKSYEVVVVVVALGIILSSPGTPFVFSHPHPQSQSLDNLSFIYQLQITPQTIASPSYTKVSDKVKVTHLQSI